MKFFYRIKNKKGSFLLLVLLMVGIILPILICAILELNSIASISKKLKTAVTVSAKGASLQKNEALVPTGIFELEANDVEQTALELMTLNTGINFSKSGSYYIGTNPETNEKVYFYVCIYNERHENTDALFPTPGSIPMQVIDIDFQIAADRPTVLIIARYEHTTIPFFGSRNIDIIQYSSSQLNVTD